MPVTMAKTSRRGFTLVELLVVLMILMLLISILVPTLSAARSRAAATACKANLRNIGQALRMYLNENKDRYPPAPALPSVNPNDLPTLMDHLRKYITKSPDEVIEVFRCPSDEETFAQEKTSDVYNAQRGTEPLEKNIFFQVFQSKDKVVSVLDAADFHGRALPINCLFLDGRVEQVSRPKGM
jgi:prepilin-type N-terminal cleavage/methylation domain-containing protein/prepilin-type processing-associated H-X9-DG protein